MEHRSDRSAVGRLGYAVGMGIVGIALVGVPLQFAYPDFSAVVTYGGSFVAGALVGAAATAIRGGRV